MAYDKLDIVIKNGRIIDGTGNPWYRADVGINKNKIVEIAKISEKGVIDINA